MQCLNSHSASEGRSLSNKQQLQRRRGQLALSFCEEEKRIMHVLTGICTSVRILLGSQPLNVTVQLRAICAVSRGNDSDSILIRSSVTP